ncbi:hypothetical protein ACFZDP_47090 [Streptomyces mirabilis]|uniref:hypothetical protein n=1 Tax=Streptomyces mirabilis TaxID=68239 RepID=UPI0006CDE9F3|nr:hypothetical protein OK006_8087 [Actinobacteria bacterium OK006]
MPDPRRVRGRRNHLGVLSALCLTRVLGEARFQAQTAGYAADTDSEVRAGLDPESQAVRGSRTGSKTAVPPPVAALHGSQTVIAQPQVAAKSNEIPAFTALLARFDLRDVVVTADARPYG